MERYRGRGTRYVCPKCGRKYSFTRYIDTYNNNIYINDSVGRCNRIDKCGYHYTPRQYYLDHPWLNDKSCPFVHLHRENGQMDMDKPRPMGLIDEHIVEGSLSRWSQHHEWLATQFGSDEAERIARLYGIGGTRDGRAVFWQRDAQGRVRTGKIMAYDAKTGKRTKGAKAIDWVHSLLRRKGIIDDDWHLVQCLYGEHLLAKRRDAVVAVVEAYKTAHVGAVLMPEMVWVATDALTGLTAERLEALHGRDVILFPDEGKGYELWSERIAQIARSVGFNYRISRFMEGRGRGDDIADLIAGGE